MKNLTIILISILFLNCKRDEVITDNKIDLLVDTSKTWYISEYPDPCPRCSWPHKIVFGKDTTLNSNTYKVICDYNGDSIEFHCKARVLGYMRDFR